MRETRAPREQPKWLIQRPVISGYYTGVGGAKVDKLNGNHIELAKNNALNDLVTEISVTISANSVFRQFENNEEFKEEFESYSNSTIRDHIKEYELVDSWGNDEYYWVYYKLSKATYQSIKRRELENAKALAYDFYQKARNAEGKEQISNALIFYFKAFDALKHHLDEDLSFSTSNGDELLLGNELIYHINGIYSRIVLNLSTSKVTTKVGKTLDSTIDITATYRGANGSIQLSQLPMHLYFKKGDGIVLTNGKTNENGRTHFTLMRVTGNTLHQELIATLDINSMIEGDDVTSDMARRALRMISNPPEIVLQIEVKPILAIFESNEREFGKRSVRHAITNEVKKYFSDQFFSFTNDTSSADVVIKLKSNATKGSYNERHRLHTVFIDCYLSIYDASNQNKVYYKGFDQVRGQQVGSWENGLKDAQQNTLKRIKKEILPEVHKLDL